MVNGILDIFKKKSDSSPDKKDARSIEEIELERAATKREIKKLTEDINNIIKNLETDIKVQPVPEKAQLKEIAKPVLPLQSAKAPEKPAPVQFKPAEKKNPEKEKPVDKTLMDIINPVIVNKTVKQEIKTVPSKQVEAAQTTGIRNIQAADKTATAAKKLQDIKCGFIYPASDNQQKEKNAVESTPVAKAPQKIVPPTPPASKPISIQQNEKKPSAAPETKRSIFSILFGKKETTDVKSDKTALDKANIQAHPQSKPEIQKPQPPVAPASIKNDASLNIKPVLKSAVPEAKKTGSNNALQLIKKALPTVNILKPKIKAEIKAPKINKKSKALASKKTAKHKFPGKKHNPKKAKKAVKTHPVSSKSGKGKKR